MNTSNDQVVVKNKSKCLVVSPEENRCYLIRYQTPKTLIWELNELAAQLHKFKMLVCGEENK